LGFFIEGKRLFGRRIPVPGFRYHSLFCQRDERHPAPFFIDTAKENLFAAVTLAII
jgi:hypothetical protein